ncbi:hypothetical protein JOD64_001566 [Micromonospora luteifusca]|uniref:Uncharacterized protein n=1 Tax=Micromonospora luteifusca TaxID=709860 RepID=A0ABS2LR04_9ACTN|nr:hypothetical protein [Micromonospora luteifusca]MBM7490344.1 hypothetical protein [Micromonospora luteifusca]
MLAIGSPPAQVLTVADGLLSAAGLLDASDGSPCVYPRRRR